MKRIRRVSLRLEHREVSVSITQAVMQTTDATDESSSEPTGGKSRTAENCPDCGAPWLPDLEIALREAHIGFGSLQGAILDRRLHLHREMNGKYWICERSLQQMKETP